MTTKYQEGTTEGSSVNINESHQQRKGTSSQEQQASSSEWMQRQLGAFWMRKNKWSEPYLSGYVMMDGKKLPLHIYKNKYHEEGRPHFIAYATKD